MEKVSKDDFIQSLILKSKKHDGSSLDGFDLPYRFMHNRIQSKFVELSKRYIGFTQPDDIFSQMVIIICELVEDKDFIEISSDNVGDEISWLIFTTEQRIYDYIQKNFTMNYRDRTEGQDKYVCHFVDYDTDGSIIGNRFISLDDYTYLGDGQYISNHEIYQAGRLCPTEYEELLGLKKLHELMERCELNKTQQDLIFALERTRDVEGGVYNQYKASEYLDRSPKSVNRSFINIKEIMYEKLKGEYLMTEVERDRNKILDELINNDDVDNDLFTEWIYINQNNLILNEALYSMDIIHRKDIVKYLQEKPVNTQSEAFQKSISKLYCKLYLKAI